MSPGGQVAVSIRQFSVFFPKIYNSMAANTFEGTITINLRFLYELFPFFFFFLYSKCTQVFQIAVVCT